MTYIMIQNKGEIPDWGIRLLGYSNKNERQIGQFGTGLKESIALLARLNMFPIIASGTRVITFQVTDTTPQEITYRIDDDPPLPMNISPNFGKADWTSLWMVFRELFCNAYDEEGLYHSITDAIEPVAGATRVYLPDTPMTRDAYLQAHDRLLFLNSRHHLTDEILEKNNEDPVSIYHRKVFIQQKLRGKSIYDYHIKNLKLNESRSADWYVVNYQVATILAQAPDHIIAHLLPLLIEDYQATLYESNLLAEMSWRTISPDWKDQFLSIYGDAAVVIKNNQNTYDRIREKGRKPIVVSDSLYFFLKKAGCPTSETYFDDTEERFTKVYDPNQQQQELLTRIYNKIPNASKPLPRLKIFEASNDLMGYRKGGTIYINTTHSNNAEVYIEELMHYFTDAPDFSREFQNALITAIRELINE